MGKGPDAGKDWGQEDKGTREDEMVGWPCQFNGHEFEQAGETVEDRGGWRAAGHVITETGMTWQPNNYFKNQGEPASLCR